MFTSIEEQVEKVVRIMYPDVGKFPYTVHYDKDYKVQSVTVYKSSGPCGTYTLAELAFMYATRDL